MDFSEETYRRIDAYVQGRMGQEDLPDFESELLENSELKKYVEELIELRRAYQNRRVAEFKQRVAAHAANREGSDIQKTGAEKIRESGASQENEGPNKKSYPQRKAAIWASLIAACIIGAIFILRKAGSEPDYSPLIITGMENSGISDPALDALQNNTRSITRKPEDMDVVDSLFIDLYASFERLATDESKRDQIMDYALKLLSKKEYSERYSDATKILVARVLLLENQSDKAIALLSSIDDTSPHHCFAHYYSAIGYAQKGDLTKTYINSVHCPEFQDSFSEIQELFNKSHAKE